MLHARRARTVGPARRDAAAGFTLIELMCVMMILGFLLILLPPRLDNLGDSSRMESNASTLVSVFTAAREMAIIDGHETKVQFDLPGTTKDRTKPGRFRYLVTSKSKKKSKALEEEGGRNDEQRDDDRGADEWVETDWRELSEGVALAGFSVSPGEWIRTNPRGDPVEVSFLADGAVRPPCAIRIASTDSTRVLTVVVNSLTSAAEILEGEEELPKDRDPSDFR